MGYGNRTKGLEFFRNDKRDWNSAKIIAFDAPQLDKPYESRLYFLRQGIPLMKLHLFTIQ
jgi:hypothetical protein